jgi:hypothetical protein
MNKNDLPIEKLLDPKFYLESFTKIKGKTPGLMPFVLNEAQKDLFNAISTHSRVIILKARQIGFCQHPDTKVLTSNLEWVTLDEIKIGQEIVAVDENIAGGKGSSRKMKTAIVENKFDVYEDAIKLTMDNGEILIATPGHRFLSKDTHLCSQVWKQTKDLKIGNDIRCITKPWTDGKFYDGKFGGIIDGEGSLSKPSRTGASLAISQVDGKVWDFIKRYADQNEIGYRLELDRRSPGISSKFGSKEVNKLVISRMSDIFKTIGKTRPVRFLGRKFWEGKAMSCFCKTKIIAIEHLGKMRMIDLQTSAKTYIANGFVSHNSTAAVGYLYHRTITTPGTNTALIGYNSDLTAELLDKVKTFYRTTPESIRPQIQYNSKYEISFPAIDSKILVLPSSENVGRGYTLHNVLATELAFWEKSEEKMLAIENAVPADGKIIIESTPNGMGNTYHRMWMSDNSYAKQKYGWWWGYTEEEIEIIRRRINNPMRFAQEYELEFLSSGRPVFASDLIKRLRKGIYRVGDVIKNEDGIETTVTKNEDEVVTYYPPQLDRQYIIGADVAEGVTGGDYSVFTIFDRRTGDEVAFWRGYLHPDRFGALLNKYGRIYNDALMCVEINNHGLTTVTALKNLMYPRMYFRPVIKMDTMGTSYSDRLGWKTTRISKPLMIDDLRESLSDASFKIHSEITLDEMLTFVYDNDGNMVTQSSFHDDGIMASAICLQAFKVMYDGKLEQLDYENILPQSTSY